MGFAYDNLKGWRTCSEKLLANMLPEAQVWYLRKAKVTMILEIPPWRRRPFDNILSKFGKYDKTHIENVQEH